MRFAPSFSGLGAAITASLIAGAAWAQDGITGLEVVGKPNPSGTSTGFQPAATELARDQQWLDHMLLWLCIAVVALVVTLLLIVILRFNSRANPTPAKFSHNTPVEITWTLVPVLILVVLGSFSLPTLFKQQEMPVDPDLVIKATGNQWFWSYEYPDEQIAFDSFLLGRDELEANGYSADEYLLATDNAVVIPVGKTVLVQVTALDVIHSWTVPAFAVKQDAVPGRIAQLWFNAEREGVYFGQCSELCGKDHAYMPITVKVVSQAVYDDWLARTKTAGLGISAPVKVASAD
ncbi:MAG: cytochrome c oxidase subunit II [Rhodobacteraceae bacterium]|jgi:cytochrome c oxidase subunit 2|uniref:cytochrome c oxidase subunit II n=1 Tax=Albidovulum sp. TaxID=1872424 RepID=UPI001D8C0A02|nr:cytochrome c oxidase subunit II [uncultured Defluviimonas sp.]MCB2126374.1 cytochrome c oxidase subunit II [Paracoccaceae bacterium]MCC0069098.1 cytochrome c oxidase subunit II [Paracoccaceae bacterium]